MVKLKLKRLVAYGLLVCFFSACASIKPVDPAGSFEKRELRDKYIFHLRDGSTLTTNHATVTDSTFVLHTLVEDGKDRAIAPMVVTRDSVESMERVKPRYLLIAGITAAIVAGLIVLAASFDDDYLE
jgi:hypothetical protein